MATVVTAAVEARAAGRARAAEAPLAACQVQREMVVEATAEARGVAVREQEQPAQRHWEEQRSRL